MKLKIIATTNREDKALLTVTTVVARILRTLGGTVSTRHGELWDDNRRAPIGPLVRLFLQKPLAEIHVHIETDQEPPVRV